MNAPRHIDHARLRPHLRHRAPQPLIESKSKTPREQEPRIDRRKVEHPRQLEAIGIKILARNRYRLLAPPVRDIPSIPRKTRAQILADAGFAYYLCLREITLAELEVDHIIPVARGGTNDPSNLIASCRACNQDKTDHIVAFSIKTRRPHFIPW